MQGLAPARGRRRNACAAKIRRWLGAKKGFQAAFNQMEGIVILTGLFIMVGETMGSLKRRNRAADGVGSCRIGLGVGWLRRSAGKGGAYRERDVAVRFGRRGRAGMRGYGGKSGSFGRGRTWWLILDGLGCGWRTMAA